MTTLILFCPGGTIPLYVVARSQGTFLNVALIKDLFSLIFMAEIPPMHRNENWTLCVSMLRFILSLQISFLKLDLFFSMFLLSVTEYEEWFTHAQRQYWCQSSSVQNHVTLIMFQIFWREGWFHNVKSVCWAAGLFLEVQWASSKQIYLSNIYLPLRISKIGMFWSLG